jgi:hypothetical protein
MCSRREALLYRLQDCAWGYTSEELGEDERRHYQEIEQHSLDSSRDQVPRVVLPAEESIGVVAVAACFHQCTVYCYCGFVRQQ